MHQLDLAISEASLRMTKPYKQTFFWSQTSCVLNIQIRKCSMDMSTDFLTSLRGAKDPNNRYFGLFRQLIRPDIIAELRVIFGWCGLIKVNAILDCQNYKN